MTSRKKTWLSWSSGKDSAWALHVLRQQANVEVLGLLSTINEAFERVAMHAVRTELLEQQAAQTGLPLQLVRIPFPCSNEIYEARMRALISEFYPRIQTELLEASSPCGIASSHYNASAAVHHGCTISVFIHSSLQNFLSCTDKRPSISAVRLFSLSLNQSGYFTQEAHYAFSLYRAFRAVGNDVVFAFVARANIHDGNHHRDGYGFDRGGRPQRRTRIDQHGDQSNHQTGGE
jgi:hypothetical protein